MIDFVNTDFVKMRSELDNEKDVRRVNWLELSVLQCNWDYVHIGHYGMGFPNMINGECGILNGKIIVLGGAYGA